VGASRVPYVTHTSQASPAQNPGRRARAPFASERMIHDRVSTSEPGRSARMEKVRRSRVTTVTGRGSVDDNNNDVDDAATTIGFGAEGMGDVYSGCGS
jgi:hypothetical protein